MGRGPGGQGWVIVVTCKCEAAGGRNRAFTTNQAAKCHCFLNAATLQDMRTDKVSLTEATELIRCMEIGQAEIKLACDVSRVP